MEAMMKKRHDTWREAKEAAEQYFPVRVTLAQPPRGFGDQYDVMMDWLDQHVGPQRYWVGSRSYPGALLFYFVDIAMAKAFTDRFVCGVMVQSEWQHTPPRQAVPVGPPQRVVALERNSI